jgi:hypothetical protein
MSSKPFRRLMTVGVSALTLVAAVAPAAYAGEDDGDDDPIEQPAAEQPVTEDTSSSDTSSGGSGESSSDTQVAKGAVQTGAGGMASIDDATVMVPLTLAGTGLILLMSAGAGGLALSRRS